MIKGRFEMRYILFLTLPLLLCAKTTFITQEEYAAQLYKNPRGIGCQNCHGEKGEGKIVAKYIDKNVEKSFQGSAINNLDYAAFYKALNMRLDSMPRYFLTSKEISALYFYLNEEELRKAKIAKKEQEEKEVQEVKAKTQIKETNITTQAKEVNVTTQPKEVKPVAKIKEEAQAPEAKEELQETEIIDIREMFKDATEAKHAK
jgi:hypothetical protein